MKIALSSKGPTIDDLIEDRFGRTPSFIIYDLEKGSYHSIDKVPIL
jgi:predicted Fe-Mo cluster-binding NifX family protein